MKIDLQTDTRYLTKAGQTVELRRRDNFEAGEMCPYIDDAMYYYTEDGRCMQWHQQLGRFVQFGSPGDDLRCSETESKTLRVKAADELEKAAAALLGKHTEIEALLLGVAQEGLTEQEWSTVDMLRDASGRLDALHQHILKSSAYLRK